jgi:hypothetical protein
MPDPTSYETGARRPVEKTRRDDNEDFSQDAAGNKPPKSGVGNSDAKPQKSDDPHPRDVKEDPSPDPKKGNDKNRPD